MGGDCVSVEQHTLPGSAIRVFKPCVLTGPTSINHVEKPDPIRGSNVPSEKCENMSSFLQCSIELLNSYDFVKQKKCKRGLLKSKGSHPCLDCVFHPNLWSNLYPPPGPNRSASSSNGPNSSRCCPESAVPPCMTLEVLFWPGAAEGRGSQNQLHP
ncbi:hypothetical protein DUI87_22582 [Hirundo rustica rustica]|uniref:Uncharacterized protein n=1 Tax=Hirundo rustica rustica TaxID=333673 RepID=A0A3M0JIT6_HIRRU|nr:hypothetical protein DUI87_22582 [Hirundo rustica rustica]